jgi:hypothetical protein
MDPDSKAFAQSSSSACSQKEQIRQVPLIY